LEWTLPWKGGCVNAMRCPRLPACPCPSAKLWLDRSIVLMDDSVDAPPMEMSKKTRVSPKANGEEEGGMVAGACRVCVLGLGVRRRLRIA
jgi:hypothetical protein